MASLLPEELLRSLKKLPGFDETAFTDTHTSGRQVTSVRLNPRKPAGRFIDSPAVPWCSQGRYLSERPSFTADPYFHSGSYYVQEASSMFLEQAFNQAADLNEALRVLDLCAAPGGKSTHLCSLLPPESLLVSNEIIKSRVAPLTDNLIKWGNGNVVVTNNDPADFKRLPGYFDVIVADAPCSGSGMFRKDPVAIQEWSEDAVGLCSMRQKRILSSVYPSLKEQGLLVYSTCSYSKEENEDIADWLVEEYGMESVRLQTDASWNIEETRSGKFACAGYRFYPQKLQGEGFFIACFRKRGEQEAARYSRKKLALAGRHETEMAKTWINAARPVEMIMVGEHLTAVQTEHFEDLQVLTGNLYIKKAGTRLGRIAGKDLVPDHELALSFLNHPSTRKLSLDYEQAIRYLRKEEISIKDNERPGWALACFEDAVLGWAKVLANRINNYYPKELRILKDLV